MEIIPTGDFNLCIAQRNKYISAEKILAMQTKPFETDFPTTLRIESEFMGVACEIASLKAESCSQNS